MYKSKLIEKPAKRVISQSGITERKPELVCGGLHNHYLADPKFNVDRSDALIHKSLAFYNRKLKKDDAKKRSTKEEVVPRKTKKERKNKQKLINAEFLKSPYINGEDLKTQIVSASSLNNIFTDSDLFLAYIDRKESANIRQLEAYKDKLAKYYHDFPQKTKQLRPHWSDNGEQNYIASSANTQRRDYNRKKHTISDDNDDFERNAAHSNGSSGRVRLIKPTPAFSGGGYGGNYTTPVTSNESPLVNSSTTIQENDDEFVDEPVYAEGVINCLVELLAAGALPTHGPLSDTLESSVRLDRGSTNSRVQENRSANNHNPHFQENQEGNGDVTAMDHEVLFSDCYRLQQGAIRPTPLKTRMPHTERPKSATMGRSASTGHNRPPGLVRPSQEIGPSFAVDMKLRPKSANGTLSRESRGHCTVSSFNNSAVDSVRRRTVREGDFDFMSTSPVSTHKRYVSTKQLMKSLGTL